MRAKNVNDYSPEDGSQKDETGCGRAAEDRFPDQVASKPCFVVLKYEYEEKQRTCAGLPVDSHSARDCRPISNWGQMYLVPVVWTMIVFRHLVRSGWNEGWRDCSWFP